MLAQITYCNDNDISHFKTQVSSKQSASFESFFEGPK